MALVMMVALGALVFSVTPALAEQRYSSLSGHIGEAGPGGSGAGEFSNPNGVAIEQASGDVYVVDMGNNRVERFEASGAYLSQFDGAATPAGSFSAPTAVAVDQGTGDVYVVDTGHNVVDKFTATGEYLCELSGWERGCQVAPAEAPSFSEPLGVAVDPTTGASTSGEVYVSDKGHRLVDVFTNAGADAAQFEPGYLTEPGRGPEPYRPWSLAVDSSHDVYVAGAGAGAIFEYTALGGEFIRRYSNGTAIRTVGVDPLTGDELVGVESGGDYELFEFSGEGQPIPAPGQNEFGAGFMSSFGEASPGIAVNSLSQTVYAVDPSSNVVDMFDLLTFGSATTGGASSVGQTSATIAGTVNPESETLEASCEVQYGTSTAYGLSTPCSPAKVGVGEKPVSVTADLNGLQPGTLYYYRVVAVNENGTNPSPGPGQTFATPAVEGVLTGEASEVGKTSATLSGSLKPNGIDAYYYFEYGETPAYGSVSPLPPGTDAGEGNKETEEIVPAVTSLTGLKANTTYYYRARRV